MRQKLNLKNKGQISTPNEYTDNFKSNLFYIFLSVRAKSKKPLCPGILCRYFLFDLINPDLFFVRSLDTVTHIGIGITLSILFNSYGTPCTYKGNFLDSENDGADWL